MKMLILVVSALCALSLQAAPAAAQGFEIGPGGVRVYGQCEQLRRSCERGDGGCRRYRETCGGRSRESCADLRAACMNRDRLGEEGNGNCRRYRERCR